MFIVIQTDVIGEWKLNDVKRKSANIDFEVGENFSRQRVVNLNEDGGLLISLIIDHNSQKIFEASPLGQLFPCVSEVSHSPEGIYRG